MSTENLDEDSIKNAMLKMYLEGVDEGTRSWYLEVNGSRYWLEREDGARFRWLAKGNNGGSFVFEFTELGDTMPVLIRFTRETEFRLIASGDD